MQRQGLSRWLLVAALVVAVVVTTPLLAGNNYKGFERGEALITAQELQTMVDAKDPNLVILAVAKPVAQYTKGHIPGALQIWRPDYEPEKGVEFPYGGMALDREAFQTFARQLGIDNNSTVVIYDHKYDSTRVWWMFYLYGKKDCRVLDGGFQAWDAAGYEVDHLAAKPKREGTFMAADPLPGWTYGLSDIWRAKTSADYQLWDTRGGGEWTGKKLKKGAYAPGRIPWGKHLNWPAFKQPVKEGGKAATAWKDAAATQAVIDANGMDKNKHQIFYCQSGVRTTTEMFSLYLMGWDVSHLHNYDGSWIEWSYYHKAYPEAIVCEACK